MLRLKRKILILPAQKIRGHSRHWRLNIFIQLPFLLFILASVLVFSGCPARQHSPKKHDEEKSSQKGGATSEQRREVYRRIVREIPPGGRLDDVRRRGALRIALPPEHKPFQFVHEDLNAPAGFNVALARQMAEALEVKPEIEILSRRRVAALMRGRGNSRDYDIVFRTPGMSTCDARRSIRYFFIEKPRGWLTLCAAGPDDSLKRAVENILSYFKESGIYTYIYTEYFGED